MGPLGSGIAVGLPDLTEFSASVRLGEGLGRQGPRGSLPSEALPTAACSGSARGVQSLSVGMHTNVGCQA